MKIIWILLIVINLICWIIIALIDSEHLHYIWIWTWFMLWVFMVLISKD